MWQHRGRRLINTLARAVHEHDVGVRAVSNSLSAVATIPRRRISVRSSAWVPSTSDWLKSPPRGRLIDGISDGTQSRADIIHGEQAEAVRGRYPEQFPAPRGPDRGDRRFRIDLTQSCGERPA